MQDLASGGGGGGGGSNELSRASGLARFRSAPATWLDALLEDDDSLKLSSPLNHHHHHHHHQGGLTQLLTSGTTTTTTSANNSTGPSSGSNSGPSSRPTQASYISADPSYYESSGTQQQQPSNNTNTVAFQRMNSSPAEFLSANMEGYFSSFGGISSGYDFVGGSSLDISPSCGSKRMKENDSTDQLSPNFSSQRRGEQSGQLSTANSLVELEMEKLLEDSVPCRVRAKRGCATHPRSIAERVRRTRISDRIRKLQELVPNMDKQTNTSDMLEEAVEYVKTLQRQIQELTEQQKKCKCIAKS